MGKIFDALERHKKESTIKIDPLPKRGPEKIGPKRPVAALPREGPIGWKYSHKLVVLSAPDSVDAESFKMLRGQILFSKDGERPRIIMVTSAFPGEGKTYVAANLAASIAQGINEHVLLVDCDLRNPNQHSMLGYPNTRGLHEFLAGKKELSELIIRTGIEKLSLLPGGSPTPNPAELLSSNKMKEFLIEVRNRYQDRIIIIDATPSQITAEANVLANFVDGILFVVRAEKSPKENIRRSIENLGNEKILGVIFNGYSQGFKSYNKYYKKYYK